MWPNNSFKPNFLRYVQKCRCTPVLANGSPNHLREESMLNFLIFLIIGSSIFSNAIASEQFVCKTSTHIVTVNLLSPGKYQYIAWNKPKSITKKPDKVIVGGKKITEGTGVCRYTRWEFNNSNVQYIVSTPATCTEGIPPSNATGQLAVFINDEHKKSWWCLE